MLLLVEKKVIDINGKVREWREKAKAGLLTREEMREAVVLLREDRKMSVEVQAIKKVKVSSVTALLDDFAKQMKPNNDG